LYSKALEEFDCNEKKIRTLSLIDYTEDGTTILYGETKESEWKYVVPESVGEKELNYACQKFNK
jgi:hypothetical protein